jgi:hypothetical protein
LAPLSVSTSKIQDGAVTNVKIFDVNVSKLVGQILTAQIGDLQVTNAKIVSIDGSKITGSIPISSTDLLQLLVSGTVYADFGITTGSGNFFTTPATGLTVNANDPCIGGVLGTQTFHLGVDMTLEPEHL